MKARTITLLLILFITNGFTQDFEFDYIGRKKPVITKETIANAAFVGEIVPDLWQNIGLGYRERVELEMLLNYFPEENYNKIVIINSVSIVAICNGIEETIKGKDETLTAAQKEMLSRADFGTNISIKFEFYHKYNVSSDERKNMIIGFYTAVVVPENEAVYPNGFKALTTYLNENIVNKFPNNDDMDNADLPDFVNFIINEDGSITDVEIFRRNEKPAIDEVVKKVFIDMPNWKPAVNSKGEKIKQMFTVPFMMTGC